jgi:hypothetical protein
MCTRFKLKIFMYSQRQSVMNHCDMEISFALFNISLKFPFSLRVLPPVPKNTEESKQIA